MPPPSKLAVATSSLVRLVKEEASYYKEMEQQEARIKKLEAGSDDENADYLLKQEAGYLFVFAPTPDLTVAQRQGLQETRNVLPTVRTKISDALEQLEARLVSGLHACPRHD